MKFRETMPTVPQFQVITRNCFLSPSASLGLKRSLHFVPSHNRDLLPTNRQDLRGRECVPLRQPIRWRENSCTSRWEMWAKASFAFSRATPAANSTVLRPSNNLTQCTPLPLLQSRGNFYGM